MLFLCVSAFCVRLTLYNVLLNFFNFLFLYNYIIWFFDSLLDLFTFLLVPVILSFRALVHVGLRFVRCL